MRIVHLATVLGLFSSIAIAVPACSYNKQCFGDGVCKITKDGQTTWEGPPDKVAAYKAKEEGDKQKAAELDQAYAAAPRRPADQPIRVVVIANTGATSLAPLMTSYAQMLEQELATAPRIRIVPVADVRGILEVSVKDGAAPSGESGKVGEVAAVDANLTRALRDLSGAADVVVVLHAAEKADSGFVSGGGGAGVAEVVRVELAGSMSSVYAFAPTASTVVGKSTAGIKLSGIDKDGHAREGELASKRDVEADRAAIQELAAAMNQSIAALAPDLPETEAAAALQKQNAKAMLGGLLGR
jgi:hypothetical protein